MNRTNAFRIDNVPRINDIKHVAQSLKDTKFIKLPRQTRFSRQVHKNAYENSKEDDNLEQNIKIMLNILPESENDFYNDYNNGEYYSDYQEERLNDLINDLNLNLEMERNSQLITKTLSESQERKRCIKKSGHNLDFTILQQPQKLISKDINEEHQSVLRCQDCTVLKSNANPVELNNNNPQPKRLNENDFVNILKQFIEKLNKSKNFKSTSLEDLKAKKEKKTISLDNKSIGKSSTNTSEEEEWILKLEKIKGNHIINMLNNSHPENTFVNGNWVRNKIIENNGNVSKPMLNDLRSEFNDTNDSTSKTDLQPSNSNAEKQIIDNADGISNQQIISNNSNNFQTDDKIGNKDTSSTPEPEKNEHLLVSRETLGPTNLLSTLNGTDSYMFDENNNWKLTTKSFTDNQFNRDDNLTNYHEEDSKNQEMSSEPTVYNYQTSPITEDFREESMPDLNGTSEIKNSNESVEPSVHENEIHPNKNQSENVIIGDNLSSAEKEINFLENDLNCDCNKKVVKNILSSTMIQNITEVKTGIYVSPNNIKVKNNNNLNKPSKRGREISESNSNTDLKVYRNLAMPKQLNILTKNRKPMLPYDLPTYKDYDTYLKPIDDSFTSVIQSNDENSSTSKMNNKYNQYTSPNIKLNNDKRKLFPTSGKPLFMTDSKIKAISNQSKNKNKKNTDKKQTYVNPDKNILEKSKINMLRESLPIMNDDESQDTMNYKTNKNIKTLFNNSSFKSKAPKLNVEQQPKSKGQREKIFKKNISNVNAIGVTKNNRILLTSKNAQIENAQQLTTKLKKQTQRKPNIYVRKTSNSNFDDMTAIERTFAASKKPFTQNKANRKVLKQSIPKFDDNNIKNIPNPTIVKLKHGNPKNSKTNIDDTKTFVNALDTNVAKQTSSTHKSSLDKINKIISKSLPPTMSQRLDKFMKYSDDATENGSKNVYSKDFQFNTKIPVQKVIERYNNDDDAIAKLEEDTRTFKNSKHSQKISKKNSSKASPYNETRRLKYLFIDLDDKNTKKNPRKVITNLHNYSSFNPKTYTGETSETLEFLKNKKDNGDLASSKLRKSPTSTKIIDGTKVQLIPKRYKDIKDSNNHNTVISADDQNGNKRIITNKNVSELKNITPAQTSLKKITASGIIKPLDNYNIASTAKFKKSNDLEIIADSPPLYLDEKLPTENKHIVKPPLSIKNKNEFNRLKSINPAFIQKVGPNSNLKSKYSSKSNNFVNSIIPNEYQREVINDYEYGPYKAEDFQPITFEDTREKPISQNKNSRLFFQNPFSWQSLFGNQLQLLGLQPIQPVPIVRPEYDDYYDTWRNNKNYINDENNNYPPETNIQNFDRHNADPVESSLEFPKPYSESMLPNDLQVTQYKSYDNDNDTPDPTKYRVKEFKGKSVNHSAFEVLPPLEIVDGVVETPLVDQKTSDSRGSQYISDIYIPIEKSVGQQSGITLSDLLMGDLSLFKEYDERFSAQESTTDSALNPVRTRLSITRNDSDYLANVRENKEEKKQTVPIHIIQIFNGLCPNKKNSAVDAQNSMPNGGEVDNIVLSARQRNAILNSRQISQKLGDAYKHFDSDILDRFLQVYAPHMVRAKAREKKSSLNVMPRLKTRDNNAANVLGRSIARTSKLPTRTNELVKKLKPKGHTDKYDSRWENVTSVTAKYQTVGPTKGQPKRPQKNDLLKSNNKRMAKTQNVRTDNEMGQVVVTAPTAVYDHLEKSLVSNPSKNVSIDVIQMTEKFEKHQNTTTPTPKI